MTPISKVIINKQTNLNPIWIMRQAEDIYLSFEIRSKNTDFIKLCLNENLSQKLLQPLKRFDLDAQ